MLVAFSISPVAQDPSGSVTEAVAAAVRVVRESGLPHETNAMFTNIEGEWDEVMAVVKRAVDVVAEVSPRVGLGSRPTSDRGTTASSPPRSSGSRRPCPVKSEIRVYRTGSDEVVLDLTRDAADFVAGRGDGLLQVFVPHATAGIAIIETGAGSDDDLLAALADLLPADDRWSHRHGSSGHGRSHVMPAIVPPHCTVPVIDGRLALGTWQSICLVDLNVDNDRREVRWSFLAG